MSKTFHILTPLRRYENLEKLINMLTAHRATTDIHWHVICDDDAPFQLFFRQPWIHVYYQNNSESTFWGRCNFAINRWLDNHPLNEEDMYQILNDDDALETGFYDKVSKHDGGLIIVSMKRGDKTPDGVTAERAHSTNTLVAEPGHMKVGHVGVEQFIVSGKNFRGARLPLRIAGDGELVQYLTGTFDTIYEPEAFVQFNYFEKGRWASSPQ